MTVGSRMLRIALLGCAGPLTLGAGVAGAQDGSFPRPVLNFNGVTGALDTPTAQIHPDADFTAAVSHFGGITRSTLSFQIFPRVQGTFRYSRFEDLNLGSFETYYDRSFDVSVLLLTETRFTPALKLGLQDFVGTGLLSGEYLVATKSFAADRLHVSAGLGWGRLGSANELGTPFGERDFTDDDVAQGGDLNDSQWFRGPVAPFGSVIFEATPDLTLIAEYSSDAYELETGRGDRFDTDEIFERESDFNFGAEYRFSEGVALSVAYLYGSEIGANLNFALNPYRPVTRGAIGPAPGQVAPRPSRSAQPEAYVAGWADDRRAEPALTAALAEQLQAENIVLEALDTDGREATVRFRNRRYQSSAQAVGRVARTLTRVLPPSVDTFRIVPVNDGLTLSEVTIRRSDLERLVNAPNASDRLLQVARIGDAAPRDPGASLNLEEFPAFDWSIGPYIRRSYFDPEEPLRFGVGIRASAEYEPTPGLILQGSVAKRLGGTIDENERDSNSQLPNVRTSFPIYDREGDPALESLTAAYYFKPAPDIYGRVTGGYLERMFGGVSGELLWKPVSSRLALGAELNYARQRAPDLGLGFADGSDGVDEYDVITGHASAYYQLPAGFHAQVDAGRYLAGDYGATFGLDRTFANGWSVGAFATFTDVSAEEFGEGSFDKGIRFSIPVSWFTGEASRRRLGTVIRPVTRDGGARLGVPGRIYGKLRDYDEQGLTEEWGRVWR